jgi:uncharacterized protein
LSWIICGRFEFGRGLIAISGRGSYYLFDRNAPMNDLPQQHQVELESLCRQFRVRRLELFGSTASGRFQAESSDLDFLVEFEANSPMGPFHQYFDFLLALQEMFGRPVDLVEPAAVQNAYFRDAVSRGPRMLLYAA